MHMEKSLAASPLHSRFFLRLGGRVCMCLKEMTSLLRSHKHLLHNELQTAFLRWVCPVLGAQRQELGREPPAWLEEKQVSPSCRSKKFTSMWQLNTGEPDVCKNCSFSFLPPRAKQTVSKDNAILVANWSQRGFLIFLLFYSKLQYLLTKYDFCHISIRAFFCTHTWKQIDSCFLNKTFKECCQWWEVLSHAYISNRVLLFPIQYIGIYTYY